MTDLRLNPSGDIEIYNFSFRLTIDTIDRIKQKIRIKLRLFLGEYYLDISKGVPFFEKVLKKNPNISEIDFIFKSQILEVEEVSKLLEYNAEFDTALRKYTVDFKALLIDGSIIDGSEVI